MDTQSVIFKLSWDELIDRRTLQTGWFSHESVWEHNMRKGKMLNTEDFIRNLQPCQYNHDSLEREYFPAGPHEH